MVGDDPCRNALFSVGYLVLKKYVFYWNKDHPTTRPCSQQDKCDLYIQLSYVTNCHFVYFNYYVTLWNSLVLSLRIFLLCSSSAFCLTMTCPLTPIPCSCAQIPHIEQYGGIIAQFFFTSIPRLSNRAFILRNFFPEFLLGLCRRISLLHAHTVLRARISFTTLYAAFQVCIHVLSDP